MVPLLRLYISDKSINRFLQVVCFLVYAIRLIFVFRSLQPEKASSPCKSNGYRQNLVSSCGQPFVQLLSRKRQSLPQGFSLPEQDCSNWSVWSSCDVSCGFGRKYQTRNCSLERVKIRQKSCFVQLCPSYLSKPRIHFSGRFKADVPTVNNVRCFYDPAQFCPSCDQKQMEEYTVTYEKNYTVKKYNILQRSFNNFGGGEFYFINTTVTSACWNDSTPCSTDDPINETQIENLKIGKMVDLDVDWQGIPNLYGLQIHVPGFLSGKVFPAGFTKISERNNSEEAFSKVRPKHSDGLAVFKSKLIEIKWHNYQYAMLFNNSTQLSINFVIDMYNRKIHGGRLTGTIGMTSMDDGLATFVGRTMKVINASLALNSEVPFFFDRKNKFGLKKLVLDMSGLGLSPGKGFENPFISTLHRLVLVVEGLPEKTSKIMSSLSHKECQGINFIELSKAGDLDYLLNSTKWYTHYGGVIEISLDDKSEDFLKYLTNNRIGMTYTKIENSSDYDETKVKSVECRILFLEPEHGISLKFFGLHKKHLSVGDVWKFPVIASKFGRPLENAKIDLKILNRSAMQSECQLYGKPRCNPFLAEPKEALRLSQSNFTDKSGMAEMHIEVVENPKFPRSCGLDGQVYPFGLTLTYDLSNNNQIRVGEGGMFPRIDGTANAETARKQCKLNEIYSVSDSAIHVYSSLPNATMSKRCPSWTQDIRPIFSFYQNIAPVMAQYDIINLKDIQDVREKLSTINMSMFGYEFDDPHFMPVTRDLSPDKTELVRRWIECQMNPDVEDETENKLDEETSSCFENEEEFINKSIEDLRDLLQLAMWIEFYTIPPYLTAYFSIKPGRAPYIKESIRGIAAEEMLHLALVCNLLNSIGGTPDLTNAFWHPQYPTRFPSKHLIQIIPHLELRLEKFSRSLAKDLFSEIERPADYAQLEIIVKIVDFWKKLASPKELLEVSRGNWVKSWQLTATNEKRTQPPSSATMANKNNVTTLIEEIYNFSSKNINQMKNSNIDTIGGLYTYLMLLIMQTETCVKLHNMSDTIFNGPRQNQVNSSLWFVTEDLSKGVLFPVTNLTQALKATLEIAHEGEGASPCFPFISDLDGIFDETPVNNSLKSHYVRFLEMAYGNEILRLHDKPPSWSKVACMDQNLTKCSCILNNGTVIQNASSDEHCLKFCFVGPELRLNDDGVWPLKALPLNYDLDIDMNLVSKEAREKSDHFDQVYTNLIKCLNKTFNGHPEAIKSCMGDMYKLNLAGERLVQTPIMRGNRVGKQYYALPRWRFIKDQYTDQGLYVDNSENPTNTEIFC